MSVATWTLLVAVLTLAVAAAAAWLTWAVPTPIRVREIVGRNAPVLLHPSVGEAGRRAFTVT